MTRTYATRDGRRQVSAQASRGAHSLPDSLLPSLSASLIEVHEVQHLLWHFDEEIQFAKTDVIPSLTNAGPATPRGSWRI